MKKQIRLPDPKIVPPPGQSVDITLEFTRDELRLVNELAREWGCWSLEELFRTVSALLVQGQLSVETLTSDWETP